jgi:hypothetical protein
MPSQSKLSWSCLSDAANFRRLYTPNPGWPWWVPVLLAPAPTKGGEVRAGDDIKAHILAADRHLAGIAGNAGTLLLIQPQGPTWGPATVEGWHRTLRSTPAPIIVSACHDERTCRLEPNDFADKVQKIL